MHVWPDELLLNWFARTIRTVCGGVGGKALSLITQILLKCDATGVNNAAG
jgi:hypothetical protein